MDTTENLSWRERTDQLIAEAEKTNDPHGANGESRGIMGWTLSQFVEQFGEMQDVLHGWLWMGFDRVMKLLANINPAPALHHKPEVAYFFERFAYLAYADKDILSVLDAQEVYCFYWLCEDVEEIVTAFMKLRDSK